MEITGDRDGTVCSVTAHILSDAGAYPLVGPMLAANTGRLMGGAYRIPCPDLDRGGGRDQYHADRCPTGGPAAPKRAP